MTGDTDRPSVGETVEVTLRGRVTRTRDLEGHRALVVDVDETESGVFITSRRDGDLDAYLYDTIDGEFSDSYTDHRAAEIRSVETGGEDDV